MRIFVAAPLAVALSTSAAAATLHQYAALALSPAGDRIAALESDAAPDAATKPHARIVLRSASTGRVLSTLDPCRDCEYSGLEFAPDGRLAFLVRNKGTTRLMLAGTGLLGSFTTFSTLVAQVYHAFDRGHYTTGLVLPLLSLVAGVLALTVGVAAGRQL